METQSFTGDPQKGSIMSAAPSVERTATNGIRTALGIAGVLSIILGTLILVWPLSLIHI